MWKVYILRSKIKRWYYVGSTNDISRRIGEHDSGKVRSTASFRPLELVYTEDFNTEVEARNRERQIKGRRIEKERIIAEVEKK